MMRAIRVYGEEAVSIGLATEVANLADLPQVVKAFAADLAQRPRRALAILKQGLRRGSEGTLAGEWEFNVQAQAGLLKGDDFREAVAAIHAGRKPVY